jgi:hypothetical protein
MIWNVISNAGWLATQITQAASDQAGLSGLPRLLWLAEPRSVPNQLISLDEGQFAFQAMALRMRAL